MNALIRNQKSLIGLNPYGPTGFYNRRTKSLYRTYRTKKYRNEDDFLRYSLRNNINSRISSLSLPATQICPINQISWNASDWNTCNYRNFSLSSSLYEQHSSKVEVTVQSIKNKEKEKEDAKKKDAAVAAAGVVHTNVPEKVVVKKSLKQRIWEEILHYYHGFRLLFIDINICRKLLWRVLMGKKLTRREHRLLIRTTSDLFRLLPFSIFIIIPFMELLLPVFIKLFPGMLPSTFQTDKEYESKLKQSLQVKLEVAKFLQKTLDEMAVQHNITHKSEDAKEFSEFFKKIKNADEYVSGDDIIKLSKQFDDEITLDSLSRDQLMALCRILEATTIGTNNFLQFQIRMKLRSLAADDKTIQREGVDALNMHELQQACRSRGMRAYGLSEARLRTQLQEWINLSLNEKVPNTLLLLSRALMVPDDTPTADKLKATISILPDTVATQTKAAIGEREGKIDNKTKIEIIKEEQRKIKEEREERKEVEKEEQREKVEMLLDKAPVIEAPVSTAEAIKVAVEEEGITSKDAAVLGEALENLSKNKKILLVEKEVIKDLKEEIEEYKEDIEELNETTGTAKEITVTRASKILFKKVNNMINKLDTVVNTLENKEKKLIQYIEELPEDKAVDKTKDELVRVDELLEAVKGLQMVSGESRISAMQKALAKIDADQDGQVKVDDVLKVIEAIGPDDIKLSEKQLGELVNLLDKEEILEAEDKIEKALAKSLKESQSTDNLVDKAPTVTDHADSLDETDEKHILKKPKDETKSDQQVLKAEEKKTPKSAVPELPPTLTTPIPPPVTKTTNTKDKML